MVRQCFKIDEASKHNSNQEFPEAKKWDIFQFFSQSSYFKRTRYAFQLINTKLSEENPTNKQRLKVDEKGPVDNLMGGNCK